MPDPSFSDSDMKRYNDWKSYLRSNGISIPQKEHFTNYASLPTLCLLRPVLAVLEPETIGPMRVANIGVDSREKRQESEPRKRRQKRRSPPGVGRKGQNYHPTGKLPLLVYIVSAKTKVATGLISIQSPNSRHCPWSTVRDAEYVLLHDC